MNGVELFLLGRRLMRIGERAIPAPDEHLQQDGARAALLVLCDVVEHPGSSIGAIAARTLLPQSQVSAAITRLRQAGSVRTATDPDDGRRTVIEPAKRASARVAEVRASRIDRTVLEALDDTDAAAEVIDALATLARHLLPRG